MAPTVWDRGDNTEHDGSAADGSNDSGKAQELFPVLVAFGHQGGDAPQGNIAGSIGHAPEDIADSGPANDQHILRGRIGGGVLAVDEGQHGDDQHGAGDIKEVRSALAPFASGLVHDGAHHGVVDGVPHPGNTHQNADSHGGGKDNAPEIEGHAGSDDVIDHVLTQQAKQIHIPLFLGISIHKDPPVG